MMISNRRATHGMVAAAVAWAVAMVHPAWMRDARAAAARSESRPNFVVVLCDDLGYGDVACFGNPVIKTPNVDRLAEEGMWVGDWKILGHLDRQPGRGGDITAEDQQVIKTAELSGFELYNLRDDIGESTDLAQKEPERLEAMAAQLRKLYHEVRQESPIWPEWKWPHYEGDRIRAAREAAAKAGGKAD